MSPGNEDIGTGLVGELAAVAQAAGTRLRAETDADAAAAAAAAGALVTAATSAMAAGHALGDITQAEAQGKEQVRDVLRAEVLKAVDRSGRSAREARVEHHQAIARAMRLGLSTREIAAAAQVTHGTVRAIANRMASGDTAETLAGAEPEESDA